MKRRYNSENILVEDIDSSVYANSDYQEILDKAGILFYSDAEYMI